MDPFEFRFTSYSVNSGHILVNLVYFVTGFVYYLYLLLNG